MRLVVAERRRQGQGLGRHSSGGALRASAGEMASAPFGRGAPVLYQSPHARARVQKANYLSGAGRPNFPKSLAPVPTGFPKPSAPRGAGFGRHPHPVAGLLLQPPWVFGASCSLWHWQCQPFLCVCQQTHRSPNCRAAAARAASQFPPQYGKLACSL